MTGKLRNHANAVAPLVPPLVGVLTPLLIINGTRAAWITLLLIYSIGAVYVESTTKEFAVAREMMAIFLNTDSSWQYARFVIATGRKAYIVVVHLARAPVWFIILSYRQQRSGNHAARPAAA